MLNSICFLEFFLIAQHEERPLYHVHMVTSRYCFVVTLHAVFRHFRPRNGVDDGPLCITCKHLIPDHLECRCDVSITTRVRQLSYSVTQAHFVSVLVELDGEFGVITEHNHPDLRERLRNRQKLHELSHEIQDEPVTVTVRGVDLKGH